jgi:hypothetical protein
MEPDELARIRAQLDRDLAERMARPRHQPPTTRHQPETSRAYEQRRQAQERQWLTQLIDQKLSAFAESVGKVIAQRQNELLKTIRAEIAAAAQKPAPARETDDAAPPVRRVA